MATISKRGDRWQARVRRKGGPPTSRTFRLKADAEKWAAQVEVDGERGGFSTNWPAGYFVPAELRLLLRANF